MSELPPHIMVATPAYGQAVTVPYFTSVLDLYKTALQQGLAMDIQTLGNESLVTRARNLLTAQFLANPRYSHLMFIDADLSFKPSAFFRLLDFNQPITCGVYPQKHLDWQRVKTMCAQHPDRLEQRALQYNLNVTDPDNLTAVNGFIKVLDAATGFMLIQRGVLEKMVAAFPELEYTSDHHHYVGSNTQARFFALFDCMIDPVTNRYLSEDFTFCRRWQALGGDIWCDVASAFGHTGSYTFQGDVSTLMTAKTPA